MNIKLHVFHVILNNAKKNMTQRSYITGHGHNLHHSETSPSFLPSFLLNTLSFLNTRQPVFLLFVFFSFIFSFLVFVSCFLVFLLFGFASFPFFRYLFVLFSSVSVFLFHLVFFRYIFNHLCPMNFCAVVV